MRSRLGSSAWNASIDAGRAAEHGDRQVAKARVLGEHGQQRLDDARAETVADHHAVDVAGVERARRALDAERADQADALADGDRETRIGAAAAGDQHGRFLERIAGRHGGNLLAARGRAFRVRRKTVPCSARMRDAAASRRAIAAAGALADMASASGTRLAPSSRRRAMTGVNGPLPLFSLSTSACACSLARSPSLQGSASTTPAGSTEATAAAASGQPASTIGKAPAARKASTTSGAGLSATTRNGPCSAMAGYEFEDESLNHARALLMGRQRPAQAAPAWAIPAGASVSAMASVPGSIRQA